MKKIYMTLLLLMIAIVSFAEDEVVKNGVRYTLLGKEARATLIDKELTDIVVDPEVSIEGQVYPVTYVYTNSYSDVFLNTKTISIPSNSSVGFLTSADVSLHLKNGKPLELRLEVYRLYRTNVCIPKIMGTGAYLFLLN